MAKSAYLFRIVCLAAFLAAINSADAQEIISGITVDSVTLEAIPSVSIQIKNTSKGTRSDENGNFSLEARKTDTLVFTLVGYRSLELPLEGYEPGMIRMSEKYTLLEAVTIDEYRRQDVYQGMFDDQNAQLQKKIPFYFSKARKEKIKVSILKNENLRVQTYIEVVVNNPELKLSLMERHSLNEKQYYDILRAFNEKHYEVMYYLTRAELISLVNNFFASHVPSR